MEGTQSSHAVINSNTHAETKPKIKSNTHAETKPKINEWECSPIRPFAWVFAGSMKEEIQIMEAQLEGYKKEKASFFENNPNYSTSVFDNAIEATEKYIALKKAQLEKAQPSHS